ncbi:hypothetical protein vseg_014456 [Gypsophila vaccaria]
MRCTNLTKLLLVSRTVPCPKHYSMYAISPTTPLQKIFGFGKSKKEKEVDEAVKKAKQATESLKEGAEHIRETSEHIKNTATSTSQTCINLATDLKEKATETAEVIVEKVKEPIKGAVSSGWNNTVKRVEDKVAEKIKDRVMGNHIKDSKNVDKSI